MRKGSHFLTDDDVRAIRMAGAWRWPVVLVARIFGLCPHWCSQVMRGETHAGVR